MNESKSKLAEYLKADKVIESLTSYIEVNIELAKLEIREAVSNSLSKVIEFIVIAVMATLIFIFVSITAALFINYYFKLLTFAGFGIVSLFYTLILLIYSSLIKPWLKKRISQQVGQSIQVKTIEALSKAQKQLESDNQRS